MKPTFTIVLLFFFFPTLCQVKFEKAYLVDLSGNKINCFIKNLDWRVNPKRFQYRLSEEDKNLLEGNLKNIREFKVENYPKYVRAIVDIDRSATRDIKSLSHDVKPVWEKDTIFLKVIVDGTAALYAQEDGGYIRNFFFKSSIDSTIRQLLHKEYYFNNTIATSNYYKQQLSLELECKSCPRVSSFTEDELKNYFIAYQKSIGIKESVFDNKTFLTRDAFNFKVTPGFNYSNVSFNNSPNGAKKFKGDTFFRLGLEIEAILPFNKNKWSIFIEPTYQYVKTNIIEDSNSEGLISLQTIEIPIGVRHYFFLNDKSKLFINADFRLAELNLKVGNTLLSSGTSNYSYADNKNITYNDAFGLGIGYNNNRLSVEVRYINGQKLGDGYYYDMNYKRIMVILGYKFLNIQSKVKR